MSACFWQPREPAVQGHAKFGAASWNFVAAWKAAAIFRRRTSSKISPMSCKPMGRPEEVWPQGIEMPGMAARLAEMVKMSERYIESGSADFSPILKAGVGEVGQMIASHFLNASVKSLRISERTFCALR